MNKPTFVIIGAPRSGTTTLYETLSNHPDVFIVREPWFFALQGNITQFRGPGDNRFNKKGIRNVNDYTNLFTGSKNKIAIGDASTLYLSSIAAPGNIRDFIPNVRIFAILRNPVERAFSNYLQHKLQNRETLSFENALNNEEWRLKNGWSPFWGYKRMGYYGTYLERFYQFFPHKNIMVSLYEDLVDEPETLIAQLLSFIGVEQKDFFRFQQIQNPSGNPRNKLIHLIISKIMRASSINQAIKPLIPKKIRSYIKTELIARVKHRNLIKPPIESETYRYLTSQYHDDILKTQALIQRDLSNWLKME